MNPRPLSIIPVQFPAIVPGLRIRRDDCMTPGWTIYPAQDYTVVCVLRDVAFIRHNLPELCGSITDMSLRTFWQTSHPAPTLISQEPVTLQGHELRTIAAIYRARRKGANYWMNRFNAGMDTLDARTWERLHIERQYRLTQRKLDVALKAVV